MYPVDGSIADSDATSNALLKQLQKLSEELVQAAGELSRTATSTTSSAACGLRVETAAPRRTA